MSQHHPSYREPRSGRQYLEAQEGWLTRGASSVRLTGSEFVRAAVDKLHTQLTQHSLRTLFIFVTVLLGPTLLLWQGLGHKPSRAVNAKPVPTVHVAMVSQIDMPTFISGMGHIEPFNAVQITSRVDGQIERILFVEGQQVEAGEILILLDPRPYQAAVNGAEGALAKDQAQFISARADLQRFSKLRAQGYISQQTYDHQLASLNALGATLKSDRAALEVARLNLRFASIKAAISGRIGKRLIDTGNVIHAADNKVLAEIVQTRPISVIFTIPQDALRDVQDPTVTSVEVRSGDDQRLLADGRVVLISNRIDEQTGTIELKAQCENRDQRLWPGEFVNIRVATGIRRNVQKVPINALQSGISGWFVYVVNDHSEVVLRRVQLLNSERGEALLDGLKLGEMVVIDHQDRLKPGMVVTVRKNLGGAAVAVPRREGPPS